MKLTNNTILITGGATGIGFSLAERFLALGNRVIICGRREDRLVEAQKKLPRLYIKVCDVSDDIGRSELSDRVVADFPELNVLINNAGIQKDIDLTKGTEDLISGESEIKINLEAPISLTALLLPHLMKQIDPALINVTSGLAFTPMPTCPVYCATKAAFHTYTLLLRHQLASRGVKVFELIPPMVDTELNITGRNKRNMQFRGVTADEYAAGVIKGLENDEHEVYFGMTANSRNVPRAELETRLLNR